MAFLAAYKDAFATIGGILAIAVFAFGVYQFSRAERWKRNEFIAKSAKEMHDDPACHRAMMMLDWAGRKINLGTKEQPLWCDYKYSLLISALRTKDLSFTEHESAIRDIFDQFFYVVSHFERAIQNGLVSQRSVYPYFAYWIEVLRGERHMPEEVVAQISDYIDVYGYVDVRKFLARPWPEAITRDRSLAISCGVVDSKARAV